MLQDQLVAAHHVPQVAPRVRVRGPGDRRVLGPGHAAGDGQLRALPHYLAAARLQPHAGRLLGEADGGGEGLRAGDVGGGAGVGSLGRWMKIKMLHCYTSHCSLTVSSAVMLSNLSTPPGTTEAGGSGLESARAQRTLGGGEPATTLSRDTDSRAAQGGIYYKWASVKMTLKFHFLWSTLF